MNQLIAQGIYKLFPFTNLTLNRMNNSILGIECLYASYRNVFIQIRERIESTLVLFFPLFFGLFLLFIEAFDQSRVVNGVLEPVHYDRCNEKGNGHEATGV